MTQQFSVLILTLNERKNIRPCLRNVLRFTDDVVVLDSGSIDGTQEMAQDVGARVFENPFVNFATQRNYGLRVCDLKHPWAFHLDADERLTPAVVDECRRRMAEDRHSGYFVPAKQVVFGRWLRHASCYPVYQMRFHKIGEVEFIQVGHGQREGKSQRGIAHFDEPYVHYPFSKGLSDWFARHNRYSTDEALEVVEKSDESIAELLRKVTSTDDLVRWRSLKRLSSRVPFPAAVSFLYLYLIRGGVLDRKAGLTYCWLQAMYQEMIRLKVAEIRQEQRASANNGCSGKSATASRPSKSPSPSP
ncbi:glycosyltransferase family 2 protein [bacterium]|nr:glycosyltransferase family 2 protein [bacterium]